MKCFAINSARTLRTDDSCRPLGMLPVARANGDSTPLIDKVHNATAHYIEYQYRYCRRVGNGHPVRQWSG